MPLTFSDSAFLRLVCCVLILGFGHLAAGPAITQAQPEMLENSNPYRIGLALSGGGAKGFAHIGVIRVMDSLGIPIDYVGGTSIGAIIAAFVANSEYFWRWVLMFFLEDVA